MISTTTNYARSCIVDHTRGDDTDVIVDINQYKCSPGKIHTESYDSMTYG